MRFRTLSTALLALALAAGTSHAQSRTKPKRPASPPPANFFPPPAPLLGGSDSCVTPDPIFGTGLFAFDDTSATTGSQGQTEPLCNEFGNTAILADVWFVWTPNASGVARITTVNQTIVDTKLAAFPGNTCPAPNTALACNDDDVSSGTFQSTISFACTAGTPYVLQVGLFPGPFPPALPGTGNLSITIQTPPSNDACASPSIVSGYGPAAPHAFDTTLATTGAQGQNNAACESFATRAIDHDVWFQWTAPVLGWVRLTTCGATSVDTKIAVYQGAGCPVGAPVVCDDDGCGLIGGSSEARFFASVGTTYTIQLGTFPGQPGGPGSFTIEAFTPALGDTCGAALRIAGPGPHAFDTRAATTGTEGQSELLCTKVTDPNPRIHYDLWYAWTATGTGLATWSLCGATMDSKIAVYAGLGCPGGPALACSDEGCAGLGPAVVTFPVTAGAPYLLQLGCWPGAVADFGTFTIDVPGGTGTPFCFGSGAGTACPCSPAPIAPGVGSNGCPNSSYSGGANLRGEGTASVAADTLVLEGTGMPNGPCLYFQGSARQSGGNGLPFGDGLLCAGGAIVRLGITFNTAGASQFPTGGGMLSALGLVSPAGATHTYQCWFRDANVFCTTSTFNLSNGLEIPWSP